MVREYRLVLIKTIIILIFLQFTITIVNCEGRGVITQFAFNYYYYYAFKRNLLVNDQINFLLNHYNQWNLNTIRFEKKSLNFYVSAKNRDLFVHYFIDFGFYDININYMLTHNYPGCTVLTEYDMKFNFFEKKSKTNPKIPQLITNHFYCFKDDLDFELEVVKNDWYLNNHKKILNKYLYDNLNWYLRK